MKSREDSKRKLYKIDLDVLFDTYLKPLRSKNARNIFKVLAEEKKVGSLTTFDIQTKLQGIGIELSKKEINGWLHSILKAGLVSKEEKRGKPTIINYDDKYTFDLWRLTDLGIKLAEELPNVMETKRVLVERDVREMLKELAKIEPDRRYRILRTLDEVNMLLKLLQSLFDTGGELNRAKLRKRLEPSKNYTDRLLLKYSNQDLGIPLIIQKPMQHGFKTRILRFLGLSLHQDTRYILTKEGIHITEKILHG